MNNNDPKKADFIIDILDEGGKEVDLDAAIDSDPKLFERLLDNAVVTNGREPDSVDLQGRNSIGKKIITKIITKIIMKVQFDFFIATF